MKVEGRNLFSRALETYKMPDFEWELVAAINRFFEAAGIRGVAYRLKQSRYTPQVVDLLVDSPHPPYYLAIECKSIDARKAKTLYFTQHFSAAGGVHQIERIDQFIDRTGRRGFLAVELRRGPGRPKTAHLLPWNAAIEAFRSDSPGIPVERIEAVPPLGRRDGSYLIEAEDLDREI
ncbi:MAG: hypothetical protein A4E50_01122 [Methanosaeta sp. PtaB.Bin087]|nr:MAG: hypothetical protein A4E50_01122 [Methanosaeta sp. PtaB.Bin087]OPY51057.1 MAG: hypothetical protein A4E51_01608 [Methanosaeta sp. PtaU1.Bin055]